MKIKHLYILYIRVCYMSVSIYMRVCKYVFM